MMRLLLTAGIATAALALPATSLAAAELQLTDTTGAPAVESGGSAVVSYTLANVGDEDATTVEIVSTVDPTLGSVVADEQVVGAGFACGIVGTTVTCTGATLAVGAQVDVSFGLSRTNRAAALVDVTHNATGTDAVAMTPVGASDSTTVEFRSGAVVELAGGYPGVPTPDADNEVNGASYDERDTVPYRVTINNTGTSATDDLTFIVQFNEFDVGPVSPSSVTRSGGAATAPICVADNDNGRSLECTFSSQLANGLSVTLQVNAPVLEGSSDLSTLFSVTNNNASSVDNLTETTNIVDLLNPVCAADSSYYERAVTRAQLAADGTITVPLTCTDPDGGALTFGPVVGTTGTLSQSGANAVYTPNATTQANADGVQEYFVVQLTDDDGDTTTAYVQVSATTTSDIASTVTGPASFAVPAAGGTVTYTNTVRNNGPEARGTVFFGWTLSDKATVVSATAGGATATCQNAEFGNEGEINVGCGSVAMPAVGSSVVGTITIRFAPGVKSLALPASTSVTASAFGAGGSNDPAFGNNESKMTTALAAEVVNPTVVDPLAGTAGDDRIVGSAGRDVVRAGDGNDTAIGGAGNDRLFGGLGNDLLSGGNDNDALYGEAGSDRLIGGSGIDYLDGGSGRDFLFGGTGNDRAYGGVGNDDMSGGAGNDKLFGQAGNDRLYCGTGLDVVDGGAGNDGINCIDGAGGDVVIGGIGRDYCIGDTGDRFIGCERVIVREIAGRDS